MKKLLITIFATCSIPLSAQITEISGLWEPYEMNYIYHIYTDSDIPTEFQDGWYDNSDADAPIFILMAAVRLRVIALFGTLKAIHSY